MNNVERILRVLHVQPGDGARRSADQIQLSSGGGAQNRSAGERPVDRFGQNLRPIPEFGKAERAERETDALAYLTGSAGNGIRCAGSNTNQLDAPAAEIGDNSIRIRNPGEHSGRGEPRLLCAVDYLDRHAALAFDLGGKSLSVAGVAHGGGCQNREMIDGNGAGKSDEAAQVDQRQGDTFWIQPAGGRDAAPQAAHNFLVK